ncbi:radical SAM protein [Frankia sp. Cr2]|uniref:radical SAM protein n=1 Tax=Frankia sp. Cr2 TaxID=3073932 RepID=UPI002AD39236|nr:radical SAM protein [Frankia sp. Cr2]
MTTARNQPICSVVMQPTTLCNLNCSYCYLPSRKTRMTMAPDVARAVATAISDQHNQPSQMEVIWHGGEPLTVGTSCLSELFDCFAESATVHIIQTNATLIDHNWASFFSDRQVHVGVSIDGDAAANAGRIDYAGRPAFERIMNGISVLQAAKIPFDVIAVVSQPHRKRAESLYTFAQSIGCRSLAINIEEREGVNTRCQDTDIDAISDFWSALAESWIAAPTLPIREIDRLRSFAGSHRGSISGSPLDDPFPTVAWDGSLTLHSPELAGFTCDRLGDFACGNVLTAPMIDLITQGQEARWVREYAKGVELCHRTCSLFEFCQGGPAANRYFETGWLDIAETDYCRNSRIALVDGILADGQDLNNDPRRRIAESSQFRLIQALADSRSTPGKFDNRPSWDN